MRRHDTDLVSLFFAFVLGLAGLILLGGDPSRGSATLGWVGPLVAVITGLVLVLAMWPRPGQRSIEITEPKVNGAERAQAHPGNVARPIDGQGSREGAPDQTGSASDRG